MWNSQTQAASRDDNLEGHVMKHCFWTATGVTPSLQVEPKSNMIETKSLRKDRCPDFYFKKLVQIRVSSAEVNLQMHVLIFIVLCFPFESWGHFYRNYRVDPSTSNLSSSILSWTSMAARHWGPKGGVFGWFKEKMRNKSRNQQKCGLDDGCWVP